MSPVILQMWACFKTNVFKQGVFVLKQRNKTHFFKKNFSAHLFAVFIQLFIF